MDDVIRNLYALFDAAWEENNNGRGTDITKMVTTFVPCAIQNLQAYQDTGFEPKDIVELRDNLGMALGNGGIPTWEEMCSIISARNEGRLLILD